MIEGRDYILIENDLHCDHFSIQLAMKRYAGVVYKYGNVRLHEQGDSARLEFDYNIESVPDYLVQEELQKDESFHTVLGDILVDILQNTDAQIGNYGSRS